MKSLSHWLFGQVHFQRSEEYLEFRYRFLMVLMFSGIVATCVFILAQYLVGTNYLGWHFQVMHFYCIASLTLWMLLRGHKHRFVPIAIAYEIFSLLEDTSALIFVAADELRLLWLFINIPGVYILLGQRAGLAVGLLTIIGLGFGNSYLVTPYSTPAMGTLLTSLVYLTLMFHVFSDRSISYFRRMRESNRRLQQLASHDTLTGVLTPRAYYERCDQLIRVARRHNKPFAVLFIDLDHFKQINDTHGHAAGDIVLKSVAQCISRQIRESDALGRIGGEEFSLFLPDTPLAGALQLAENLRFSIETLHPRANQVTMTITASIGVADHNSGNSMETIQQQADQAMYQAKQAGRNRVSTLDSPSATPIRDEARLQRQG